MYRIGIVTTNIERDWASKELLEAAEELAIGEVVDPLSFELRVDGDPSIKARGERTDVFDAYIMRGFNRRGEIDYQYEILELLQQRGKLVINSPAGLSLAESKAQTTFCLRDAGLPVPCTRVTQDPDDALEAVREFGAAVIKPLYGSHGIGIERVDAETCKELLPAFLDTHGAVYIQEYVPNQGRDIRAFIVGDDIPAAIYRVACEGEWKTNVFQGSRCERCELSARMRELSLEAARVIGLDYTGIDIIEGPDGPMILELNGAPSWYGLLGATGRNVAVDVVSHVLRKLEHRQCASQPAGFQAPKQSNDFRSQ